MLRLVSAEGELGVCVSGQVLVPGAGASRSITLAMAWDMPIITFKAKEVPYTKYDLNYMAFSLICTNTILIHKYV